MAYGQREEQRCNRMSLIAQTKRGPIEYRIVGQGPAILVLNGGHITCHSPLGHEQTISLTPNSFSRQLRVIYYGLAHTTTRFKQKCECSCNPERDEISQGNAFSLRLHFLRAVRRAGSRARLRPRWVIPPTA